MTRAALRFITPLYTGDASRNVRRVVNTGLLGSLRWWYEALIRGLGGWACDPTDSEVRCPPGGKIVNRETVSQSLCPACQLFGATSWARRFYLTIEDGTHEEYPPTGKGRTCTDERECANREGEPACWYFPSGRGGEVAFQLLPRCFHDNETELILLGLLEFIRRNAALGAKTNLGYGLFEWEEPPADLPSPEEFVQLIAKRAQRGRRDSLGLWPDLREMFFAEVVLSEEWSPTEFVNFKCQLRSAFRQGGFPTQLRHFLLGKVSKEGNEASKIKMALLPNKQVLRVWGWIPRSLPEGVSRSRVIKILRKELTVFGAFSRWREFDSPLDTVDRYAEPTGFLRSLMED